MDISKNKARFPSVNTNIIIFLSHCFGYFENFRLKEAIAYLKRKKPYIDCYALRKELGYRNSSNPAEKSNNLVVAQRQKHNGMSWSKIGSSSLAVITMVKRD